jgi:hypothetical protein
MARGAIWPVVRGPEGIAVTAVALLVLFRTIVVVWRTMTSLDFPPK